jgi:hypothetical protein
MMYSAGVDPADHLVERCEVRACGAHHDVFVKVLACNGSSSSSKGSQQTLTQPIILFTPQCPCQGLLVECREVRACGAHHDVFVKVLACDSSSIEGKRSAAAAVPAVYANIDPANHPVSACRAHHNVLVKVLACNGSSSSEGKD